MSLNIFLLSDLIPLSELRGPLGDSFSTLLNQLGVSDIRYEHISDSTVMGVPIQDQINTDEDPRDEPRHPDLSGDHPTDPSLENPLAAISLDEIASGNDQLSFTISAHLLSEATLSIPALDAVTLVLAPGAVNIRITISGQMVQAELSFALGLRLSPAILKPMRQAPQGGGQANFEPDPNREAVTLQVATATFKIDQDGHIDVTGGLRADLSDPAMIGETGIIIAAAHCEFDLFAAAPNVKLDNVIIVLPDDLPVPGGTVVINDASLDGTGFSGSVSLHFELAYNEANNSYEYRPTQGGNSESAEIFGYPGGLRHFGLAFDHNQLTGCDISGSLMVRYFDEPVDIRINIAANGTFTVTLVGADADGITLKREELLALNIKSLSVSKDENNVGKLVVSGGLEPLLMSSDGLQWPRLDVVDLSIDSTGKFSIKEAWLDLKELATLDLWGFHFELRRIGIGSQERDDGDQLWVDLSGGLRLIEQIPVALDVDGFRLTWPRNLLDDVVGPPSISKIQEAISQFEVEFGGIYLFFGVPDAIEFEGLIRFFKSAQEVGFSGDVALRVPASGFAAEAGLLVGLSFDPPFPFLYVYFGVELPAGIPLGQSGLALKGALGMFGLNVSPKKTEDQNWYSDWYKREPIGAHPADKWKPEANALALGVGVTITTADGYVKGTRGLIVLAIPGPILMIEGRALILSGLQPNAEPPLRALAVFDGGAGTVQFNIEAEATLIADMLKANGMLEAFFDFNDLTNWHIYLGQDTPRDRRIRADILKLNDKFLFKADAYLMMDMVGAHTLRSRIGASIGFEPDIPPVDPVKIEFAATLEGDGLVTARPEQFSGEVDLSAHIRVEAFGFTIRMSASAQFLTEGPRPFKVGASVDVEVEWPDPFEPFETTLEFQWESIEAPPVESPLSEIAVNSRFVPDGGGFTANAKDNHKISDFAEIEGLWEGPAKASPVVPVDSQPIIGFGQRMNSPAIGSFLRHPNGREHHYDIGAFHLFPTLTTVNLYEHPKRENDSWSGFARDWELIASTTADEHKPLRGVWLAESEPQSPEEPSPRRLQLWTDNPLSSSARALGSGYTQFCGAIQAGKTLAEQQLEDNPDLMRCAFTEVEPICVDFKAAGEVVIEHGDSWEYQGLHFESPSRTAAVRVPRKSAGCAIWFAVLKRLRLIVDVLRRFANWIVVLLPIAKALVRCIANILRKLVDWPAWLLCRDHHSDPCLFIDGDINIHFHQRVVLVRIVLCQARKLPKMGLGVEITARRGHMVSKTESDGRGGTITKMEWIACDDEVPAQLTTSEQEWVLETTEENFDCVHIVGLGEFAIREICYTTAEEVERSQRAIEECGNNPTPLPPGRTLLPGAYYRLDVITTISGEMQDLLFRRDTPIYEMLDDAYDKFLAVINVDDEAKEFHQTCFFQTEGPPTNLRPYVKWVSPEHQSERFFYADNLAIRFLRSNLAQMFGVPFAVSIQIKDAQGKSVIGYVTKWLKAGSTTEFPEESVWEEHRETLNWPDREVPKDDVLVAELVPDSEPRLLPQSRYQMEIVRAEQADDDPAFWYFVVMFGGADTRVTNTFFAKGADVVVYYMVRVALGGFKGELQGHRFATAVEADVDRQNWSWAAPVPVPDPLSAVLFSSTFVTSRFASFEELASSYTGAAKLITARKTDLTALPAIKDVQKSASVLARARWDWEHAEIDHRFELLKDGRKGLEAARLVRREAEATHDEKFRALAESLGDLYFQPVSDNVEIYLLRVPTTNRVSGVWIRSPESLDVRVEVFENPDIPESPRIDLVGRTEIALKNQWLGDLIIPIITVPNADSTQLLIFPKAGLLDPALADPGPPLKAGEYSFVFNYQRDYNDDFLTTNHRYDRPVEHFGGVPTATIELKWSWK